MCSPKESENVPSGHGRSVTCSVSLVEICLKPVANKADKTFSFARVKEFLGTLTASESEPREFLGKDYKMC